MAWAALHLSTVGQTALQQVGSRWVHLVGGLGVLATPCLTVQKSAAPCLTGPCLVVQKSAPLLGVQSPGVPQLGALLRGRLPAEGLSAVGLLLGVLPGEGRLS